MFTNPNYCLLLFREGLWAHLCPSWNYTSAQFKWEFNTTCSQYEGIFFDLPVNTGYSGDCGVLWGTFCTFPSTWRYKPWNQAPLVCTKKL